MGKLRCCVMVAWVVTVAALPACSTTRSMMGGGGQSQTWSLTGNEKVPAAQGSVGVRPGGDGNQTVEVRVKHLAPPSRVYDGTQHYVVWLLPEQGGGAPQNLGILGLNDKLEGDLTSQTPYRNFQVLITAEAQPNVTEPSGNRVMAGMVNLRT